MTHPICIYDVPVVDQLRRGNQLDPVWVRRLRNRLFKRFAPDHVATQGFPWANDLSLHSLDVHQRFDSALDGATKLLLRTHVGMLLETVILRIATGRTTLCLSSQIGCGAACDFCATGKMGVAHNLSSAEILDQVLHAGQLLAAEGRVPRNIVFMGMGEPLHNEANLFEALRLLTAPEFFNHSPRKILVSSVGVADAMLRCAEQFPKTGLAISLHSVRQTVRERLIPLARKYPLDELRHTLIELNRIQTCPVMVEYLMLAGVNDSSEDARELIDWLSSLNVHVNLIPYNAIDEAPHLIASNLEARREFANVLKAAGLKATIRYSLGRDIAAACGQLVRRENREIARRLARCG